MLLCVKYKFYSDNLKFKGDLAGNCSMYIYWLVRSISCSQKGTTKLIIQSYSSSSIKLILIMHEHSRPILACAFKYDNMLLICSII